ncbi:hypothetical protein D3C71_923560 [compost metagenome]
MPRYSQIKIGNYTPMIEEGIRDDVQEQLDSFLIAATLIGYHVDIAKSDPTYSFGSKKRLIKYIVSVRKDAYRVVSFSFATNTYSQSYLSSYIELEYSAADKTEVVKNIRNKSADIQIKELLKLL